MILILVSPSFFDLSKYIAVDRSRFLLRTYTDKKLNRGRYAYWGQKKKLKLYYEGKKRNGSYSKPRANFIGRFYDYQLPFDEEYQKTKIKSLAEAFETKEEKSKKEKDKLKKESYDVFMLDFIKNNTQLTMKEMAKLLNVNFDKINNLKRRKILE